MRGATWVPESLRERRLTEQVPAFVGLFAEDSRSNVAIG